MARIQKVICASCTGTIRVGESYCDHCGQPTTWASYEERIEWEVQQWRNARGRSGTSEIIQPRYARSRGSGVAVAEMDALPPRAVATSADTYEDASPPDVLRESLFARLRGFVRRLLELFNARAETSSVDDAEVPAHGGDDALESVARPALFVVEDLELETPEPIVAAPEVVAPEVVAPEVVAPEVVAPEVVAPEVVAPEVVAPEESVKPAAAATDAASKPAVRPKPPRKRPNRPTNKELLQRTLTTLERVEARLHHLEEEIEEIDQAVRKAAAPDEDDDLEPPAAAGPFGYI